MGTLCIIDTKPRTLSASERDVLAELAAWVQAELTQERELSQATVIQRALLPQATPELAGYTLAAGGAGDGRLLRLVHA